MFQKGELISSNILLDLWGQGLKDFEAIQNKSEPILPTMSQLEKRGSQKE